MSAPPKPWEIRRGISLPTSASQDGRYSPRVSPPRPTMLQSTSTPTSSRLPPAPPPRNTSVYGASYGTSSVYPRYGAYNTYGSGYGGYGTPFSSYGGYGGGYNMYRPYGSYGYGQHNREESQFTRKAEERTRSAFQSVESVVGAFGSIAMMLESTYVAIHSCFRALLGVIDHFTSLRSHLWHLLASMTLVRKLLYWLKRIVQFLRRSPRSSVVQNVWEETMVTANNIQEMPSGEVTVVKPGSRSLWPSLAFLATIFGIPWLLWRLVKSLALSTDEDEKCSSWINDPGAVACVTLYNYSAQRNDEMSFQAGEQLILAPSTQQPRIQGWALAQNGRSQGLVPQNYIQVLPRSGGGTEDASHTPQTS